MGLPFALAVYSVDGNGAVFGMILLALVLGSMYLGPTFATAQRLLRPRERALGSALLLFIINLIGLGLGPLLTGVLSDAFRSRLLQSGMSDPAATAAGLVWAMRLLVCISLWGALHFALAARSLRQDVVG